MHMRGVVLLQEQRITPFNRIYCVFPLNGILSTVSEATEPERGRRPVCDAKINGYTLGTLLFFSSLSRCESKESLQSRNIELDDQGNARRTPFNYDESFPFAHRSDRVVIASSLFFHISLLSFVHFFLYALVFAREKRRRRRNDGVSNRSRNELQCAR